MENNQELLKEAENWDNEHSGPEIYHQGEVQEDIYTGYFIHQTSRKVMS
jgi:hypothetical protein